MSEAERYQQDRAVWAEKKKAWVEHEQRLRDRIRELEAETTRLAQAHADLRAELEANAKLLEAAHQKATTIRAETLKEAAREVCFKCHSPQLFQLDPTQHGRYHVPAEDLAKPIAERDHSSCEGTKILRLFMRPLFPDVCGTPGCPCCAVTA